ncbi:hypothetical protein [Streptomyces caniscabiei]|uniref:hypothetical protein n=1 Tax=Streptomyces caniscabiei TaxID=2746961 RepID=UPI0029AD1209|nr:hypothetical protein [Streptomyces caniscabiei]MDX2986415.1 hypothetical protein [Streptomyces caniscabiei]
MTSPNTPSTGHVAKDRRPNPTVASLAHDGFSPDEIADMANPDFQAEPVQLRWGLNDVMYGDDDTTTVMLSGPDGEPYRLELEPERAAVLRDDLAGPELVSIPVEALEQLVRVAMWVSRGRSMAHTPDPDPALGSVYPDATARRALGALDEAGLLEQFRARAETAAETTEGA